MRNGIEHCHYCLEGHMKLCQQFFYRLKFKIFNLLPVNITFSVANIFRIRKYRTPKLKYISLLFNYKKNKKINHFKCKNQKISKKERIYVFNMTPKEVSFGQVKYLQ